MKKLVTKIITLITVVALGVGVPSAYLAGLILQKAMQAELENRALVICRSLSGLITEQVMERDKVKTRAVLMDMVEMTSEMNYSYVIDFDNAFFTHSFEKGFPAALAEEASAADSSGKPIIKRYLTTEGSIIEMAIPLIKGLKAQVHVGMSEDYVFAQVGKLHNRIFIITSALILSGVLVGVIISLRITRPVGSLVRAMQNFGRGKSLDSISIESSCQEIEQLSESFNLMIAERKLSEQEHERLQNQLNQSQKMESIGRLAGGVAHDLNNMLSVIVGNTEMAMERVEPSAPLFEELNEIMDAARRSAELTRQLLAFARKQAISPRVVDLNRTVEAMLKMVGRIIGEQIELKWCPQKGLWLINIDPSQIDQIVANLCVNARDAIDGVGEIKIITENVVLDNLWCSNHPGAVAGEYVMLQLSDNGCGMDKSTLENIFEPFFTTKGLGKGTGLGLATVYGIVNQNSGLIEVKSEPGDGATFNIYLPRYMEMAAQEGAEALGAESESSSDEKRITVLLVEDETAILKLTRILLEKEGYKVIAAESPLDAIEIAKRDHGKIDLLMTDVIMPHMNGSDLAANILSIYPDMRLLFMSGYTADIIAIHGVLGEEVNFIQKPFSKKELCSKVREALNKPS